jgi:hypothetical protein
MAPGPVRTGVENLAPTGIRSTDRPAQSESLYRLHYLDPIYKVAWKQVVEPDRPQTTIN